MTDSELSLNDLPQPVEETTVPVDQLDVDGDNPNEQSDKQFGLLKENMRKHGWLGNAIVVNTDYVIADGEHRWRAAQEIGLEEVPVKVYDIDEPTRRLWRQELNKISGEHDTKRDALEYDYLLDNGKSEEVSDLVEASGEDLDELLAEIREDKSLPPTYEYDVDHNVYFEDCVEGMQERVDDDSVDCVITDPPYGIDWNTSSHRADKLDKIEGDGSIEDAIKLFRGVATELSRVLRPDGHAYVFTRWDVAHEFKTALENAGFEVPNCLAWVKNNIGLNHQPYQYRPKYELCLYAYLDSPRALSDREGDVLEYDRPNGGETEHPTEKPVPLVAELMRKSTAEGDTVLDPFMGSGTTAVAAIQNDRNYIGFELDEDNYKPVIERRIKEAQRAKQASVNTPDE